MSLVLNGTSQYLWLASSLLGNSPAAFTLACWVKGAAQDGKFLLSLGRSTDNNPVVAMATGSGGLGQSTSALRPFVRNDAGTIPVGNLSGEAVGTAYNGAWRHVAVTYASGTMTAYVAGSQAGQWTGLTPGTITLDRTAIGCVLRTAAANFFAGRVAEVVIKTVAASATEISNLAAGHRPSEYPTGLVDYLSLKSDATSWAGNAWTYVDSAHADPDTPTFDANDHPAMVAATVASLSAGGGTGDNVLRAGGAPAVASLFCPGGGDNGGVIR